jgi:hypothetical protein
MSPCPRDANRDIYRTYEVKFSKGNPQEKWKKN